MADDVREDDLDQEDGDGGQAAQSLDDNEDLQKVVFGLLKKHNHRMRKERRAEVEIARDQRLYAKGEQNLYWDEDSNTIRSATPTTSRDDDEDDQPNSRVFDIFSGYMLIFVSTFCQGVLKVRAEADDPFNPTMISAAQHAETYRRVSEKENDVSAVTMELARLMWSDSRIVSDTYYDTDKQVEVTDLYGVLESRLMIVARTHKRSPVIQLETEEPICFLKAEYPDARDKIGAENGEDYDRKARLAVMRSKGSDTEYGIQSADGSGVATFTRSFIRPEAFEDVTGERDGDDEVNRTLLKKMFPTGLLIKHNGDTYLSSEPVDVDARIDVLLPSPGDGQSRSSVGKSTMPIQDSVNQFSNMAEETLERGLPLTLMSNKLLNAEGMRNQPMLPGDIKEVALDGTSTLSEQVWESTPLTPSAALTNYIQDLAGPRAQFANGQLPVLQGGGMEDQKTASGYAQAKNMALGRLAITWKPALRWYARIMTQRIKMAFEHRQGEITATLPGSKPGAKPEPVKVNPKELGGASFTVEGDDNFPVSWSEKRQNYQALVGLASNNPVLGQLLMHPDNLALGKSLWGLDEFVVPQDDQRDCQLEEIAEMEDLAKRKRAAAAQVNPSQPDQPAPSPGPMVPGMPPPAPQSSVPIDGDFDDHDVHLEECKRWMYSPAGRTAKTAEPGWYLDVRAHAELHMAAVKAAQPAPEKDKPSVAINFGDLPPDGQVQAAAEAGITIQQPPPPPVPPPAA